MRFIALEVSGENFNAGNLEKGDYADLYIIPDLEGINDNHIVWLNEIISCSGVKYVPHKDPGILIENILIAYIDTSTGQSAKYVSIRVPKPLDEAISFLEQISVFEFIKR